MKAAIGISACVSALVAIMAVLAVLADGITWGAVVGFVVAGVLLLPMHLWGDRHDWDR